MIITLENVDEKINDLMLKIEVYAEDFKRQDDTFKHKKGLLKEWNLKIRTLKNKVDAQNAATEIKLLKLQLNDLKKDILSLQAKGVTAKKRLATLQSEKEKLLAK